MTASNDALRLRRMTEDDLAMAAGETFREGWSADRAELAIGLAHDPEGAWIAELDGTWAGMVSTAAYRSTGWIGNLIVPPAVRGRGVGSVLMEAAIGRLEGFGVQEIRLDGDPPGEGIYRRLGFAPERCSHRYQLGSRAPAQRYVPPPGIVLEPLDEDCLESVAGLDREAFGDDRSRLLGSLLERSIWARVALLHGRVSGYAMVRIGERAAMVGPAVADDPGVGRALLAAASAEAAARTRPVVLGILEGSHAALEWAAAAGCVERAASRRMVRGPGRAGGRPEMVLAIVNGALG